MDVPFRRDVFVGRDIGKQIKVLEYNEKREIRICELEKVYVNPNYFTTFLTVRIIKGV